MGTSVVTNPLRDPGREARHVLNFPRALHARLPGYGPSPLLDVAPVARELGVARLWVKDETARLGLRSFEALGATWALYRELLGRLGRRPRRWETLEELRSQLLPVGPVRVVAVTDGGFGLGVARAARLFEYPAVIYVPGGMAASRIEAMEGEGAEVVVAAGDYHSALAEAALETAPGTVILSDSSFPGYDELPGWVTDGYVTVFEEVDGELEGRAVEPAHPDVVVVPLGVGALAAAAVQHYRVERYPASLRIIGVEPASSPCFADSARAGARVTRPDPAPCSLGGLARGLPSPLAWDTVAWGVDTFVAIDDDRVARAVTDLAGAGIATSPEGAAAFAGLAATLEAGGPDPLVKPGDSVLVVATEGPYP